MKVDGFPEQQRVREHKSTVVISAFPACGKSKAYEILKQQGYDVLDSDSSNFSWKYFFGGKYRNPEFPQNYVEYVNKNIGKADYIFISSHEEVRKAMADFGVKYQLMYPDESCLAEWVGRCYLRGNDDAFIKTLIENWDKWIDTCRDDTAATKHIVLKPLDYLIDYLNTK